MPKSAARIVLIPSSPIRTERLLLRCWEPADAPLLKSAVDRSLDHLRRWMPWAMAEPSELPVIEQRLATFLARFRAGEEFIYGIFNLSETEVLGGTGLHRRIGPDAFEIGYWIRVDMTGRGYATDAASAMTYIGFKELRAQRLEIRCDPDNHASAAIPRRLGYTLVQTIEQDSQTPQGELRDTLVWEMLAAQYDQSDVRGSGV